MDLGIGSLLSFDNLNGPLQFAYDVFNTERNYQQQRKLYNLQVDQYNYQKALQERIFNREDNAVQRRVADLKAAGMNPLLAAGGAASAGQAVSTTTPSNAPQHAGIDILSRAKQIQDISMTKAQQELLNSQAKLAEGQSELSRKQAQLQQMTIDWYKNHPGYAPGVESGWHTGKGLSSIFSAVSNRVQGNSGYENYKRNNPKSGTYKIGSPGWKLEKIMKGEY